MEQIEAFKCKVCGEIYNRKEDAYRCEFIHARSAYANCLLKEGYGLGTIEYRCGFNWNLNDEQKKITKDNCFVISHWQCCDKPAYRITGIEENGFVDVWGCGSWSGYYGHPMEIRNLPKPHPAEELFIDGRYGK